MYLSCRNARRSHYHSPIGEAPLSHAPHETCQHMQRYPSVPSVSMRPKMAGALAKVLGYPKPKVVGCG